MFEKEPFFKIEKEEEAGEEVEEEKEKTEIAPESRNEKIEIGDFVLEPVDREANRFHFLQNLTEWHHSCSEEDNRIWKKEVGEFTEKEKETIEDFKKILEIEKYSQWNEKGLVSIYTTSGSPEERTERLEENVSGKDRETIEKCFSIMETPFSRIWEKNEPRLLKARQEFIEKLERFETSDKKRQLEEDLSNFFGPPEKVEKLKIFFLMREFGESGTASLGPEALTLHSLDRAPKLSLLYHEMTHKSWESDDYKRNVEKVAKSVDKKTVKRLIKIFGYGRDMQHILNESIVGSFLPHGCLAEKHFPEEKTSLEEVKKIYKTALETGKIKSPDGRDMSLDQVPERERKRMISSILIVSKLAPLSKRYIEEKRMVDESYCQEALNKILSVAKELKNQEKE